MAEQTTKSIIVGTNAAQAFAAWSDFESFPRFMKHIKSITRTGERSSHWVAEGPLGKDVEWDAEVSRFEPGKRIAWRSTDGGPIKTSGQVLFNELPKGQTEITVTLQYVTHAMGAKAAHWLSDPEKMLEEDLRSFKAHVEGRVPAHQA